MAETEHAEAERTKVERAEGDVSQGEVAQAVLAEADHAERHDAQGRADGMRERRSHIVRQLSARGRVEVAGLAAELAVTEETIRRDLRALEEQGQLTRAHGGAVPVATAPAPWWQPADAGEGVDPGVVAQALEFIPLRGAIYLDGGATAEQIAINLPAESHINLVTPSLNIAMLASEHPTVQVLSTGGYVDSETGAEEGEWARQTLMRVRLDLAMIAVDGVSREGELLASPNVASLRATALRRAERTVLVLCSGGSPAGFAVSGTLSQFDVVVTDAASARARERALQQASDVREVSA